MYEKYLEILRKDLPIGESFDILERKFMIGSRKASIFFTDGLTDGVKTQIALSYFMRVRPEDTRHITTSAQLMEEHVPFLDSTLVDPKNASQYEKERPHEWSQAMIQDCCSQAEEKMYSSCGRRYRQDHNNGHEGVSGPLCKRTGKRKIPQGRQRRVYRKHDGKHKHDKAPHTGQQPDLQAQLYREHEQDRCGHKLYERQSGQRTAGTP